MPDEFPQIDGGIFSDDEFDRREAVGNVLTEYYPHAKEAILSLEVFSRKRSERAVYELRDTLDHLSIALNIETSPSEARRHLAECHTHLRRAAIEPYEWLAEKKFLEIEKMTREKWLFRIFCLQVPSGDTLMSELKQIALCIIKGRATKGTAESLCHMQEGLQLADKTLETLKPKEFYDRLHNVAVAIFCGVLFTIIGVIPGKML